ATVVLALLVISAGVVRLPYYSIGPGPARDVEPLIHVSGAPLYQSQGHFIMTSITFRQLTPIGLLVAWVDPSLAVVSRSALFAPGETDQAEQRRAVSQMDQSKIDAVSVVLR